jgi:hypothetical protein
LSKNRASAALRIAAYDNRKIFVLFLLLIVAQAVDATLGNLADIYKDFTVSSWGIALFTGLSILYIFGQYFLLGLVKAKNREKQINRIHFNAIEKTVTGVQYILIAIVVFLVSQIIFTSQYYTAVLNVAVIISAGFAVYILSLLAYWFLSWFVVTKAPIVLLYGLAMALSAVSTIGMIILFNTILLDKEQVITPNSDVIYPPASSWANTLQTTSGIAAFVLVWAGTVLLLRHNIQRIGRLKFWALSSTPLVVFSTIYLSLYQVMGGSFPADDPIGTVVVPVLFIIYTGIAAAILIGLAFSTIARRIDDKVIVKDYLFITSYGFVLYFVTTLTSLAGAGYPPFGLINVLLVGPLSFLILTGLYRSAVSVAQDARLRSSIKIATKRELDLLYDIGSAETSKEIQRKVMTVIKENRETLAQQTGIEPSLTDNEVHDLVTSIQRELENRVKRNK